MVTVSGRLYGPGGGFQEASVRVEEGRVQETRRGVDRDTDARGLILPLFWNAHTHLGDSVVTEEPAGRLEDMVAPPHGLKFRRLAAATEEETVAAMERSLDRMLRGGTGGFCDFREGGVAGARLLRRALRTSPLEGLVLGRPRGLDYDREEVDGLLEVVDGVGVSSAADWPPGELEKLARHLHQRGVPFGLHASETRREDLDPILDLKPRFLVHLTAASPDDWTRCAEAGIPVAVTPRSQAFFGRLPDLVAMDAAGIDLMLGTDNAMLAAPSLLGEMEFAYQVGRLHGGLPPSRVLAMAYGGANLLTQPPSIHILEGHPCRLLVLDVPLDGDPGYQAVRASEADIALLAVGSRVWDRDRGWRTEE